MCGCVSVVGHDCCHVCCASTLNDHGPVLIAIAMLAIAMPVVIAMFAGHHEAKFFCGCVCMSIDLPVVIAMFAGHHEAKVFCGCVCMSIDLENVDMVLV